MSDFCTNCGSKLATTGAKFCSGCGASTSAPKRIGVSEVSYEKTGSVAESSKPHEKSPGEILGYAPSWSKVARKEHEHHQAEEKPSGYGYMTGKNESSDTLYLPKTVDSSNPELKTNWQKIISDKDKSNWILLGFNEDKSDKLQVLGIGSGGFTELKTKLSKSQGSVFFGVLLVVCHNKSDAVARRNKYVYFSWVGSGVPELIKAQAGPLKAMVQKFFGATALQLDLQGTKLEAFTVTSLGTSLATSTGIQKADEFDFGDGQVLPATKFGHWAEEDGEDATDDFD